MIVLLVGFLVLVASIWLPIAGRRPKSHVYRRWMWGLYGIGIALTVFSLGSLAYAFETRQSPPSILPSPYASWLVVYGFFIGPVCVLSALVVSIIAEIKKQ